MTVIGPDSQVTMAYGQSSAGHVDLSFVEPFVAVGGSNGIPVMVYVLARPLFLFAVITNLMIL